MSVSVAGAHVVFRDGEGTLHAGIIPVCNSCNRSELDIVWPCAAVTIMTVRLLGDRGASTYTGELYPRDRTRRYERITQILTTPTSVRLTGPLAGAPDPTPHTSEWKRDPDRYMWFMGSLLQGSVHRSERCTCQPRGHDLEHANTPRPRSTKLPLALRCASWLESGFGPDLIARSRAGVLGSSQTTTNTYGSLMPNAFTYT